MESCAKGSIVAGFVESLVNARSAGRITDEQLSARLPAPALELLDQKIEISRWYPMHVFAQLVDAAWEMIAKRDPEIARRSAAESAERLVESGRYQQLEFAQRSGRPDSREALVRQTKLTTTILAAFYNFLEVTVGIDPEQPNELQIILGNANDFAEPLRYTTEGFLNGINAMRGSSRRWTSARTAADRVVFRLPLPTRLASSPGSDV